MPARRLMIGLAVLGLALLAAGHLGRWWPPGDSLAVARLWLLVAALPVVVGLMLTGARRVALLSGLAVAASGWVTAVALSGGPVADGGALILYQKNLLFDGGERAALGADLIASGADILTLQEVSTANLALLRMLREVYPHQYRCAFAGVGGVAVLSRHPFVAESGSCPAPGIVLVRVDLPGAGPVTVASIHLHWPWPLQQPGQVAAILPTLDAAAGPVLIGGDFNMQPWGWAVQGIARAADGQRIGGYWSSFPQFGRLVPLAIDQVMIPQGWSGQLAQRPLLGSDHLGLLARIRIGP